MATVTLKNLTTAPLYIRDLQDSIEAGETITVQRSLGELTAANALNGFIADGTLQLVSLVTTEQESFWANGGVRLATTGPITLYVSPTGSDTNTGLSASAPLLTLQAAINKLPQLIQHLVTINLAAGTYAQSGFTLSGRTFGVLRDGSQGGITIQGPATWATSTLGAGSATGTMTAAYTAPSTLTATLGTFTDSAQTWTVDALKGKFLMMTSGTASGTIRVIVGNSATTLSLTTSLSGVAINDTYAIVEPAAVLTATSGNGWLIDGIGGTGSSLGAIIISDVKFSGVSSAGVPVFHVRNTKLANTPGVLFRRTSISDTGSGNALRISDSWAATSSQTAYFESATSGNPIVNVNGDSSWQDSGGYSKGGAAMTQSVLWLSGRVVLGGSGIAVYESGAAATTLPTIAGQTTAVWLTIASALIRSTATNVALSPAGIASLPATNAVFISGGLRVVTALTGISIVGSAVRFQSPNAGLFVSGVTNEMVIGTTAFTYANLDAASPKFLLQPFNSSAEIR